MVQPIAGDGLIGDRFTIEAIDVSKTSKGASMAKIGLKYSPVTQDISLATDITFEDIKPSIKKLSKVVERINLYKRTSEIERKMGLAIDVFKMLISVLKIIDQDFARQKEINNGFIKLSKNLLKAFLSHEHKTASKKKILKRKKRQKNC